MTLPGDFAAGDVLLDTDLDLLPAGVQGGQYDVAPSSDQTGITSITAITGLSATVAARADRMYRISARVGVLQQSSTGNVTITVARAGSDVSYLFYGNIASGVSKVIGGVAVDIPGAGSFAYTVRVSTSAGTVDVINSFSPAFLLIEDAGRWT
jgi:ABC-type amino acid transport substrate-binding protein